MGFGGDFLKRLSRSGRTADDRAVLGVVFVGDILTIADIKLSANSREIINYAEVPCRGDRETALISLVEANGWQGREANLCLPLFDYQSLLIPRPSGVDDDELRNSLAWTLRDELDDRPENLVFDVCEGPSSPEGIERVQAVNMSRNSLERIVSMFTSASLRLRGVDIAPLCIGRALRTEVPASGHLVVLHMEPKAGSVFVYGDGEYHMAKRLARGLEWVAAEQAEPANFDLLVNELAVTLRRAADEYRREHGWLPDDMSVCLAPLPEYSEEFVTRLQEALGWNVSTFDLRSHYEFGASAGATGPSMLMAVGAAL